MISNHTDPTGPPRSGGPAGPPHPGEPLPPPDHAPAPPAGSDARSAARIVGAIAAALAMQFAALVAAVFGLLVALAATFEDIHTRADETDPVIYWMIPIGLVAVGLWIGSGYVAARIARNRLGWLLIGAIPAVWTLLVNGLG